MRLEHVRVEVDQVLMAAERVRMTTPCLTVGLLHRQMASDHLLMESQSVRTVKERARMELTN
jgi:hypothetical protein